MRPTRRLAAVFLLAALAAAGCSKRGESSRTEAEPANRAPVTLVPTSGELPAGAESSSGGADAAIPQAMTFADGEAAYAARKYGEATAIFEAYAGRRPDNPWGHYMLGLSAWKSGDLEKAESALEQALSADPRHVKSLVNLSRVLIDQKRPGDALDRLTRAAEIDPDSPEVHRLLGRTYQAEGRTAEGAAAYRRAIELNERDAWSMNNLGLLLLETGSAGDALPLLEKAVELRKDVPAFHNNLGMALEHGGRFGDAAAAYAGALTADPDYAKAKRNLARVEAVKGDRD